MTPAEEIRAIRAETGLNQSAFAAAYSIPRRTYQDWERGIASPPPYLINLLRAAVENNKNVKAPR